MNLISLLGPTLFNGNFSNWIGFISSQALGALVGALIYKFFLKRGKGEAKYNLNFSDDVKEEEEVEESG